MFEIAAFSCYRKFAITDNTVWSGCKH